MAFNYKKLLEQVTEYHADPLTLLSQAEEVRRIALEVGAISEKVHMRMPDGTVEVLERTPQTALQAVKCKFEVLQWLQSRADLEVTEDTTCQLIVPGLDLSRPEEMRRYG